MITQQTTIPNIEIFPQVAARINEALPSGNPYTDFENFALESNKAVVGNLPLPCLRQLHKFKNCPNSPGALVVTGMPTHEILPATPTDGRRPKWKCSHKSEASLLGIGSYLGAIYCFIQEKAGEVIHQIVPTTMGIKARSNEGSAVKFNLHTEVAYHPFRPHYLLLVCLRADPRGKAATLVANAKDICARLSEEHIETLRQPLFRLPIPESFHKGVTKPFTQPVAILSGCTPAFEIRLNLNGMQGINRHANRALAALQSAVLDKDVVKEIFLSPGEILIISNRKVVHGRTTFHASFSGSDRWLQRVYVLEGLYHTRHKMSNCHYWQLDGEID